MIPRASARGKFINSPLIGSIVNTKFAETQKDLILKLNKIYVEAEEFAKKNPEYTRALIAKEMGLKENVDKN